MSRLVLEAPDRAMLEELAALLGAAGPGVVADPTLRLLDAAVHRAMASEDRLTDVRVEFTRLLSGSVKTEVPPPYESTVLEDRAWGATTQAVAALYREAGHAGLASEDGPPDHLGIELRFLALLAQQEMAAARDGDATEVARLAGLQRRFLDEHALRWIPGYCETLARATHGPFYQAVGALIFDATLDDGEARGLLPS